MKVVNISTLVRGGAGNAAYRLHLGLNRRNDIESTFLQIDRCIGKEYLDNNVKIAYHKHSFINRIERRLNIDFENRYKKKMSKTPHTYEVASFPRTYYSLEDTEYIKNADIVNLHWISFLLNYPSFFKNVKKPIVWTLHDMNAFQGIFHYEYDQEINKKYIGNFDRTIYKQKLKWTHQALNLTIVCPSEWLKKKSENSEILGQYPHYLIPNGLNISDYPQINKNTAKETESVHNGLKTILFVANGIEIYRKGFDILSSSLTGLDCKPFNLITVGSEKFNFKNNNINHIHYDFIDDISKLNNIYTAADLTVIPSREDNLPNVMLESFANGTPVLGFSNSGMAEHIKTGINGILVNQIHSNALTGSIKDFFDNKYTFDADTIRKYTELNFSENRQVEKYVELYKQILNK